MIPGSANSLLLTAAEEAGAYQIERSLRFNSSDSAYLSRDFTGSGGSNKVFTLSFWAKYSNGNLMEIFAASSGTTATADTLRMSGGVYQLYIANTLRLSSTGRYRDYSAWYHVVLYVNAPTYRIYVNGVLDAQASGPTSFAGWNQTPTSIGRREYSPSRYVDGYLADIHFIDGQALDPTSFGEFDSNGIWQPIDASGLTYGTNGFHLDFSDNSSAAALGTDTSGNGNDWTPNNFSIGLGVGGYPADLSVSGGFKLAEPASRAFDSSLSTGAASIVDAQTITWTPSNTVTATTSLQILMQDNGGGVATVNGISMSQGAVGPNGGDHYYDYTGSFPITITSLTSKSNSQASRLYAILVDGSQVVSPSVNGGNDSLVDTPTNYGTDTGAGGEVRGNYATLNPLYGGPIPTNGNLDVSLSTQPSYATISFTTGKWYWELTATAAITSGHVGVMDSTYIKTDNTWSSQARSYVANGNKYDGITSAYGASWANGDVIGVAVDMDAGTIVFYKNGANQGTAFSDLSGKEWRPFVYATTGAYTMNFGQRPFAYTAPSGYKALCTANLDDPQTITTSGSYTGNGVADGPFVYLNGVPTAMTVDGNAVTFGTHADKLSNGFKIRTTSTTYNQNASTYNYSITSTGDPFKIARAQSN